MAPFENLLLIGVIIALCCPLLAKIPRLPLGLLLASYPVGVFLFFALGQRPNFSRPWIPELGVVISFGRDGLGLLLAFLISGIGSLILIAAPGLLKGYKDLGRFYGMFMGFMVAMLALVQARDLVTLFVAWELTSVTSYFLIGHKAESEEARRSARQALIVTASSGLVMLVGMIGLSHGRLDMVPQPGFREGDWLFVTLILVGCLAKSAQFPFQFWLPNAMAAPTPVSAYLHSATLVQAGVLVMSMIGYRPTEPEGIGTVLIVIGLLTLGVATIQSVGQRDIKRLLAISTSGSLGFMVVLIGVQSGASYVALPIFIAVHAFYKASLFLISGAVEHAYGTRDLDALMRLRVRIPGIGTAAILSTLAMLGLFPTWGFIAKEGALTAAWDKSPWLAFALGIGAAGFSAIAWQFLRIFVGRRTAETVEERTPEKTSIGTVLSPLVLSVVAAAGSVTWLVWPWLPRFFSSLGARTLTVSGLTPAPPLWHGFTAPFWIGMAAIALGIGLATWRIKAGKPLANLFNGFENWAYYAPVRAIRAFSVVTTRVIHHGHLRHYLATYIGAATLLLIIGWVKTGPLAIPPFAVTINLMALAIIGLATVATVTVLRSRTRLGTIALLGVIGISISLLYVWYGAPDLSLTQIVTDTLTVLIFVFVFYHLPGFSRLTTPGERARDIILAASFGIVMVLGLGLATQEFSTHPIRDAVADMSVPMAHGRNVVNTIIVDFRALDTLGEITVLSLAAIGVFTLLRHRSRVPEVKG